MGIARGAGILAGTILILGIGLYGPATLIGPLPNATVEKLDQTVSDAPETPPVLPASGASAVTESTDGEPLAMAGEASAVPMAGITKIITALVVLEEKPLLGNASGAAVPITSDDYLSYLDYQAAGKRTVTVFTADSWSEREMLQAVILGSSNNHADTLASWAFGDLDAYLDAAAAWLADNGMTGTTVVDATGLSEASVGTAVDLARLAALAGSNPTIQSILSDPVAGIAAERGVKNTIEYLPEEGVTAISRSYTDAAGICLLFAAEIEIEGESYRFYGAFIRQPDWDSLEGGVTALMASARAGVTATPLLAEGTPVVTFVTPWGSRVPGVAGISPTSLRWGKAVPTISVDADTLSSGTAGSTVGSITADDGIQSAKIPLKLSESIGDPGIFWRLSNPVPVIGSLIESWQE